MPSRPVSSFIEHHFRHFNAASLIEAARGYNAHLESGGRMFLTLAGAMSTAEIGLSLAEMIRQGKVHGISCTGANLEEDVFNLVAHDFYERIPNWRDLTPAEEQGLLERHMNRVTDTCIPEAEAMRRIESVILKEWMAADQRGERLFPHQFFFRILQSPDLEKSFQIDRKDSWLYAAMEKNLPMFVPGWEDSTLGNMYAGHCISGDVKNVHTVRTGIETMMELAAWYTETSKSHSIGFFQIGGGIAGDFPICVVPMLRQDLERHDMPLWGYFCQISDSTTSYGSYSGAIPNEKITWEKLSIHTPKFIIESDASIVAPLVFAYVLGQ
ncbi:deoxyhypusine synthase family protein [Nevskia soli]|jgi:deoxyhypusine synthase|uniref:deoxyhypusine synthase family protein n=1 Tax=Nevskia soli TaxID=418856 RepID=UPI0015D74923|nr:deoxyhypusine synthase family protein [Nevskia soli]